MRAVMALQRAAFFFVAVVVVGAAGLSLRGARCGQLTCTLQQFCNPDDNRCTPCARICDESTHNFDQTLCESKCTDYILDQRYIRRNENSRLSTDDDVPYLKDTIRSLQNKITTFIIAFSIILCLLFIISGFILCRYIKKNYHNWSSIWTRKKMQTPKRNQPQKAPVETIEANKAADVPTVSTVDAQPLSARALQAPQPRRQPAEDMSLDYSYDNKAMNLTPSLSTSNRQQQI